MSNKEIARAFRLAAQLMELHDQNPFKIRSMQNAAFKVERLQQSLASMDAAELSAVEGIGKSLSLKVSELIQRGSFQDLDDLLEMTPIGVAEMLSIKGIGPKKVRALWKELGLESVGELLYACHENRLVELKGFGAKTQELIRHSIEYANSNQGKFHYAVAETLGMQLVHDLEATNTTSRISITGSLRRKCEIITSIDLLIATENTEAITDFFSTHPLIHQDSVQMTGDQLTAQCGTGIAVTCCICTLADFESTLFDTTGTAEHLQQLQLPSNWRELRYENEASIYASVRLPYLEPEWREGMFEFEWAKKGQLPSLVADRDLRGTLHNHTTYSDGVDSLKEMALYAQKMGYEYLGVCDHSQSAFYANGLKPDRVFQQHVEIDQLNREMAPFRIFKGIESDILNDGSLDYSDDILASFDFVVASVHSVLRMDEAKATSRLIKAIEHPATTILGHPTGRLLLAREGYPLDFKKIIDCCAANGVIIELNANPYRLDIDWRHIPYALEKGVLISINPDAHRKEGYHDMHYGVCVARKGGLSAAATFNTFTKSEVESYFTNKKR